MNYRRILTNSLLALLSVFVFQTTTFAEPANLAQVLTEVKTYHDSGTYEQELTQAIRDARQFINQRADSNKQQSHPQKLAIVLDIDETSLSNYESMVPYDFTYSKERWKREILAAKAPAIQPMLSLFNDAKQHGVKVFFVTGRHESERAPTVKNLTNAGYQGWAALILRPDIYKQKSIVTFKSGTRKKLTEQGYTIIASIGDQYSDLNGGYTEKTFKLPNPYYFIP